MFLGGRGIRQLEITNVRNTISEIAGFMLLHAGLRMFAATVFLAWILLTGKLVGLVWLLVLGLSCQRFAVSAEPRLGVQYRGWNLGYIREHKKQVGFAFLVGVLLVSLIPLWPDWVVWQWDGQNMWVFMFLWSTSLPGLSILFIRVFTIALIPFVFTRPLVWAIWAITMEQGFKHGRDALVEQMGIRNFNFPWGSPVEPANQRRDVEEDTEHTTEYIAVEDV